MIHHDDVDGQKQLLREIYAKVGWESFQSPAVI
jgi:hypothetical protein